MRVAISRRRGFSQVNGWRIVEVDVGGVIGCGGGGIVIGIVDINVCRVACGCCGGYYRSGGSGMVYCTIGRTDRRGSAWGLISVGGVCSIAGRGDGRSVAVLDLGAKELDHLLLFIAE